MSEPQLGRIEPDTKDWTWVLQRPCPECGMAAGDNGRVPKIIGASLVEHREETRRRLFAALATLMEERGFDAISLADVAQAAGIGRTSVYNHVPDKESLLVEFVTYETERYLAGLKQALDGTTNPVEQLRIYVRHNLRVRPSFHMPQGLRGAVSPATQVQLGETAPRSPCGMWNDGRTRR